MQGIDPQGIKYLTDRLTDDQILASGNPMGLLALAGQLSHSQGSEGKSKADLMKIVNHEKKPDEYTSYTDALTEIRKRYDSDPESFSNSELSDIKKNALLAGKDFKIDFSGKRALKRAGLNFLDMAALGFISDDWIDDQAPALNTGEGLVGGIGSAAGFLLPYGYASRGMKLGSKGVTGLRNLAKGNTAGMGKAFEKVSKVAGKDMGAKAKDIGVNLGKSSEGLAKFLTANKNREAMVSRAINLGSASAVTSLYDEGVSGAISSGLGGMTLGALGMSLAKANWNTKAIATGVYAAMTKPDQVNTSEEHIEHVLKIIMFSGLFAKGKKDAKITDKMVKDGLSSLPKSKQKALMTEGKNLTIGGYPVKPLLKGSRRKGLKRKGRKKRGRHRKHYPVKSLQKDLQGRPRQNTNPYTKIDSGPTFLKMLAPRDQTQMELKL